MLTGSARLTVLLCVFLSGYRRRFLNVTPRLLKRILLVEIKFAFITDLLTSHVCLKVLSLISLKRGHLLQFVTSLCSCIYRKIQVKKMQQL